MCQEKDNFVIAPHNCNIVEMGWAFNNGFKKFDRNFYCDVNEVNNVVANRNYYGVFRTVYNYNTTNIEDSYLYGDLYFDLDCKEDFEKVRVDAKRTLAYISVVFKIEPECCNIFFSGSKGIHITVPVRYLLDNPTKDLNIVYKHIAENVNKYTVNKTIDLGIYDTKRLFRIANTIHEKSNLYKIPLTYDEVTKLRYEDILRLAQRPRNVKVKEHTNTTVTKLRFKELYRNAIEVYNFNAHNNIKHKATLKVTPPCIKNILENGAKEGCRNNTIAVLSSFYKNKGVDLNKATEYISKWNDTKNLPPTNQAEVNRTVRSIYSSRGSYGCNFIKNITTCDIEKCPLKRRK